jgi:thiosulfate dehydrogenase
VKAAALGLLLAAATVPARAADDLAREGERLVRDTRALLPDFDRSSLDCASCHIDAGRTPYAIPFVGIAGAYPMYQPRSGRRITLAERVDDCFRRSLNGRALPRGSRAMRALLAYIASLSPAGAEPRGRGLAEIAPARAGDPARGETAYRQRCAKCHGLDGAGKDGPRGGTAYPALWGPRAFNLGASMARASKAAAFIRRNMPQDDRGALTDQEALDVAEYVVHRPRPDFADKARDWPKGDRPPDAPN